MNDLAGPDRGQALFADDLVIDSAILGFRQAGCNPGGAPFMGHTGFGLFGHRGQEITAFDFKKLTDRLQGSVDFFIDRFGRGIDKIQ